MMSLRQARRKRQFDGLFMVLSGGFFVFYLLQKLLKDKYKEFSSHIISYKIYKKLQNLMTVYWLVLVITCVLSLWSIPFLPVLLVLSYFSIVTLVIKEYTKLRIAYDKLHSLGENKHEMTYNFFKFGFATICFIAVTDLIFLLVKIKGISLVNIAGIIIAGLALIPAHMWLLYDLRRLQFDESEISADADLNQSELEAILKMEDPKWFTDFKKGMTEKTPLTEQNEKPAFSNLPDPEWFVKFKNSDRRPIKYREEESILADDTVVASPEEKNAKRENCEGDLSQIMSMPEPKWVSSFKKGEKRPIKYRDE